MAILLQLNNIEKFYGSRCIFNGFSCSFADNQKIGVIGRNGAGKSTLIKMITKDEFPDAGNINYHSDLRLSYIEQHEAFHPDESIIDYLMRSSSKEEWQCAKIASTFQLPNELMDRPAGSLSGGYRMRIKLAAMLLNEPNFLLLDEPSNFLDLSTLLILEDFLRSYNGGFLLVSHDRELLKRTCDHTLEVAYESLMLFPGELEDYLEYKEIRDAERQRQNVKIETRQKELTQFIDRFRAKASKASQAQSKIKELKRLGNIEVAHALKGVRILIPSVKEQRGYILHCKDLSIGYSEKTVASNIGFELKACTKLAILGDNGQGKSTFLKTIASEIRALSGHFQWKGSLSIGYYGQHVYESLQEGADVYTYLRKRTPYEISDQHVLNIAGSFLFKGDDVKKPLSILSGGERARLCLAGLLLQKHDVYLLDEPTNHLDFETVEALANALAEFNGTVLFISHDRTFVQLVSSEILEVKNGSITHYPGSYNDYVYHLRSQLHLDMGKELSQTDQNPGESKESKQVFKERKELKSKLQKTKSLLSKSEALIASYQEESRSINKLFSDHPDNFTMERQLRLKELEDLLSKEEKNWIEIQENLESLETDIAQFS